MINETKIDAGTHSEPIRENALTDKTKTKRYVNSQTCGYIINWRYDVQQLVYVMK